MTRDVQRHDKAPKAERARKPLRSSKRTRRRRARDRAVLAEARAWVEQRAQGRCEAAFSEQCEGRGTSAHHIVPQSATRGLAPEARHDPARMVWICPNCHTDAPDAIHRQPDRARAAGLLRSEVST